MSMFRTLARFFPPRPFEARALLPAPRETVPDTIELTLSQIPTVGSTPLQVSVGGWALMLHPASHAGANLEVAFGATLPSANTRWTPLTVNSVARATGAQQYEAFWVRKRTTVPSSLDAESVYLVSDPDPAEGSFDPRPRTAQLSASGSANTQLRALTLAGAEVSARAADEGPLAVAGWTGAAYVRASASALGRWAVNLISGQDGITADAGAVTAATPRVTLASDDPAVALLGTVDADTSLLAGIVSAARAAVNLIAGQVGIAGGAGAAGATVVRTVPAIPSASQQSQVTIAAAASTQIAAANASRASLLIRNTDAANSVFISTDGTAAVAATDYELIAGAGVTVYASPVVTAIGDGANAVRVDVIEETY